MPTMTRAGYTPPKQAMNKPPKAEPPKKKKKRKKKNSLSGAAIVSMVVFAIAAVIAAGTIFVYTQTQSYAQAFMPGTMLMGYPLAGATRADAEALLDQIQKESVDVWQMELICMNQSYTLTAQDVSLTIDKEATLAPLWAAGREGGMVSRYLQMLRLMNEPLLVLRPVVTYDLSVLDTLLEIMRADVECASVDATVAYHPEQAEPFVFTDEEAGYALDTTGIREGIEQDMVNLASGSLTLEPTVIEPKVYRAVLENAISLRSRVVMQLSGGEASVHNVTLAAQKLNGVCVEAGETLSFNGVVGARTAQAGYLDAQEAAYGADVSGVGGGVCQASTALYRAALLGDIAVKERSAAVRPVDYCDMGQEAAVSDQGLDLVLENQTADKLFVCARVYQDGGNGDFLEVMLIGSETGKRYALESVIEETGLIEEPVYVRDREGRYATYTDERVPVSEALMGFAASVQRLTLDAQGNEAERETVSESVYEAAAPMIYVGVQERE